MHAEAAIISRFMQLTALGWWKRISFWSTLYFDYTLRKNYVNLSSLRPKNTSVIFDINLSYNCRRSNTNQPHFSVSGEFFSLETLNFTWHNVWNRIHEKHLALVVQNEYLNLNNQTSFGIKTIIFWQNLPFCGFSINF